MIHDTSALLTPKHLKITREAPKIILQTNNNFEVVFICILVVEAQGFVTLSLAPPLGWLESFFLKF